jgi:hypothetical protein
MPMTCKQTAPHSLLLLLWPPWLLLPPPPLQVSSSDEHVPGSARMPLYAHPMLLCAARAAVQERDWRRLAELIIRTVKGARAALFAVEESAHTSRTGRMEAAERTTHAYGGSAVWSLLPPRPRVSPSGPTARSSPRRGGHGAAKHAWPSQKCSPTSAARSRPSPHAHTSLPHK